MPIPPVFGPASPSPMRLWSRAAPSGIDRSPSHSAKTDSSSPSSSSSKPTGPSNRSVSASAAASSSSVRHTQTPLPAVRPSIFTTHGTAGSSRVRAAGTPAASRTSLANAFEPSIARGGGARPEHGDPAGAQPVGEPRPRAAPRGRSPQARCRASAASESSPSTSSARAGWHCPSAAIQGSPGQHGAPLPEGPTPARARVPPSRRSAPARPEHSGVGARRNLPSVSAVPPYSTAPVEVLRLPEGTTRR